MARNGEKKSRNTLADFAGRCVANVCPSTKGRTLGQDTSCYFGPVEPANSSLSLLCQCRRAAKDKNVVTFSVILLFFMLCLARYGICGCTKIQQLCTQNKVVICELLFTINIEQLCNKRLVNM